MFEEFESRSSMDCYLIAMKFRVKYFRNKSAGEQRQENKLDESDRLQSLRFQACNY